MYSFPDLEPVHCSMSHSNFCFLTCIQISQEAGRVVWYSPPFKNFPQLVVIHTVIHKGFGKVNEAKVDVFLELSCFLNNPVDVGNLISASSAFSKSSLNIWNFSGYILLKPRVILQIHILLYIVKYLFNIGFWKCVYYFLAVMGLHCCTQAFSSCSDGGSSWLLFVRFSLWWLLLQSAGLGMWVQSLRLRGCRARAQ